MASLKQQQYRRLMKEQKSSKSAQKVDHPLAKYADLLTDRPSSVCKGCMVTMCLTYHLWPGCIWSFQGIDHLICVCRTTDHLIFYLLVKYSAHRFCHVHFVLFLRFGCGTNGYAEQIKVTTPLCKSVCLCYYNKVGIGCQMPNIPCELWLESHTACTHNHTMQIKERPGKSYFF